MIATREEQDSAWVLVFSSLHIDLDKWIWFSPNMRGFLEHDFLV
jgi:hypothetical protein